MTEFWLVWRDDGPTPSRKHRSEAEARAEAQRLASISHGSRFWILRTVDSCRAVTVQWEKPHDAGCGCSDCIPF